LGQRLFDDRDEHSKAVRVHFDPGARTMHLDRIRSDHDPYGRLIVRVETCPDPHSTTPLLPGRQAELVGALGVEPVLFARQMGEHGCDPTRGRVEREDGTARQVRGYLTADIRAAIAQYR
jgi:hypothetical protein